MKTVIFASSLFASAILITTLPAAAATQMTGKTPVIACRDSAAMAAAHNVSAPSNKDGVASCTAALNDRLMASDRTATLANRGLILAALGNTDAALADLNEALARNGNAANVYVNRGVTLIQAGRYDEARDDFSHALDLNVEDQARVYFNRGMAEEKSGDLAAAYGDYRHASNLNFAPAGVELARFSVTGPRYAGN